MISPSLDTRTASTSEAATHPRIAAKRPAKNGASVILSPETMALLPDTMFIHADAFKSGYELVRLLNGALGDLSHDEVAPHNLPFTYAEHIGDPKIYTTNMASVEEHLSNNDGIHSFRAYETNVGKYFERFLQNIKGETGIIAEEHAFRYLGKYNEYSGPTTQDTISKDELDHECKPLRFALDALKLRAKNVPGILPGPAALKTLHDLHMFGPDPLAGQNAFSFGTVARHLMEEIAASAYGRAISAKRPEQIPLSRDIASPDPKKFEALRREAKLPLATRNLKTCSELKQKVLRDAVIFVDHFRLGYCHFVDHLMENQWKAEAAMKREEDERAYTQRAIDPSLLQPEKTSTKPAPIAKKNKGKTRRVKSTHVKSIPQSRWTPVKRHLDEFATAATIERKQQQAALAESLAWVETASPADFARTKAERMDVWQAERLTALKESGKSYGLSFNTASRWKRYAKLVALRAAMRSSGVGGAHDPAGRVQLFRADAVIKALDEAFTDDEDAQLASRDIDVMLDTAEDTVRNVVNSHLRYTRLSLGLAKAIRRRTQAVGSVDSVDALIRRVRNSLIIDEPQRIGRSTVKCSDGAEQQLAVFSNVPNTKHWSKHEYAIDSSKATKLPSSLQTVYTAELLQEESPRFANHAREAAQRFDGLTAVVRTPADCITTFNVATDLLNALDRDEVQGDHFVDARKVTRAQAVHDAALLASQTLQEVNRALTALRDTRDP